MSDRWASKTNLYNMYGPTEATCGATIKLLLPGLPVTIGLPNPSTRLYILDNRQNLAPRGMIGEIYLAGVQVASGYFKRPEETVKSFMPDLVCRDLGERMYRTGDRGYWNEDGEVVCLERNDRIIKLGGFRVDLNDLETQICKAVPKASAAAVVQIGDLLAVMVQPGSVNIEFLQTRIAQVLPMHAIPRHIVAVKQIPITRAGKIDYRAVLAQLSPSYCSDPKEPLGSTEREIAKVWLKILGRPALTPLFGSSNFEELGGDSSSAFTRNSPYSCVQTSHFTSLCY